MIQSFKITNHFGESILLRLSKPEETGLLISSVSGLGPVKAQVAQTDLSTVDGSEIANTRLESRNIVFDIIFYDGNHEKLSIEDLRHRCYRYFPVKRTIQIEVTNDHGTFSISGVVESNEPNIFSQMENAQISVICPDPYFEKDGDISVYVSTVVPNFQFPVSFEAEMEDIPPEEYQEDADQDEIIGPGHTVYTRYTGANDVTSRISNEYTLPTAGTYLTEDITVRQIPFEESQDAEGHVTITIGRD